MILFARVTSIGVLFETLRVVSIYIICTYNFHLAVKLYSIKTVLEYRAENDRVLRECDLNITVLAELCVG